MKLVTNKIPTLDDLTDYLWRGMEMVRLIELHGRPCEIGFVAKFLGQALNSTDYSKTLLIKEDLLLKREASGG